MKQIEVVKLFKHGGQTFYPGERRVVSEADAGYFCGVGWAKAAGIATGEPDTSEKTLEVHNSKIGHAAKTVE